LKIQIDVNPNNSKSFELNNIDNIGVGISSDNNSSLNDNNISECSRNNEEDDDNETIFSVHDTPTNYLF
jgi:hypothetical protein